MVSLEGKIMSGSAYQNNILIYILDILNIL